MTTTTILQSASRSVSTAASVPLGRWNTMTCASHPTSVHVRTLRCIISFIPLLMPVNNVKKNYWFVYVHCITTDSVYFGFIYQHVGMICFTAANCPDGYEYKECGSPCTVTCENYQSPPFCAAACQPGCFCPNGTVRHNTECISTEDCPTTTRKLNSLHS